MNDEAEKMNMANEYYNAVVSPTPVAAHTRKLDKDEADFLIRSGSSSGSSSSGSISRGTGSEILEPSGTLECELHLFIYSLMTSNK